MITIRGILTHGLDRLALTGLDSSAHTHLSCFLSLEGSLSVSGLAFDHQVGCSHRDLYQF